jgi:histidinol-phosphate aminotransferase
MPQTSRISRRRFAQMFGAGAAYVVARGTSMAGSLDAGTPAPSAAGVVRLSSNENPYGPSPMALKAMTDGFSLAWRYPDEHADLLIETLARLHVVQQDQILLGNGSGEILKLCAAAFTGPLTTDNNGAATLARPTRGGAPEFRPARGNLIVAHPTFEAILNHATINRAEVIKIPLTSSFSHDLPKMLSAAREGLIYICNPNNPTASITPKNEIRDFIAKVPQQTMILVDEAYFHYAGSPDYETVIPLIRNHPNLLVTRTFSKIYGMAGLRCGYCVGQPSTIQRLRPHQTWDSTNIMALVAAIASIKDANQVTNGRRLNDQTKMFLSGELKAMGYKHIPSQANFLMIDVKRPVRPVIQNLAQRRVQVGRVFPALPNHLRVTIGKRPDMETFLTVLRQVAKTA